VVTTRGRKRRWPRDLPHCILGLDGRSALLGQVFIRRRWSPGVRWAGLFLLLVLPLGILFLVLAQALLPATDLGFWSALTVPYAVARVLLAVFTPKGNMRSMPVDTLGVDMTGSSSTTRPQSGRTGSKG
jgi:hypothetical protein